MSTTIREGDWLRFQTEDDPGLIIEGTVINREGRPDWLWIGEHSGHIVANADGRIAPAITILAHRRGIDVDKVARAIAEADGNSQPGCVYASLARAAIEAMAS